MKRILSLIILMAAVMTMAAQSYSPCYTEAMKAGNAYYSQGRYKEARSAFESAKQCSNNNPEAAQKRINDCNAKIRAQQNQPTPGTPAQGGTAPSVKEYTVNGIAFKMVFVKGGTFTMGCTGEQGSDCDDDEKPAHLVTLSDYWIGETEVTVGLFKKFVAETGYRTDAEKEGWAWRWMKVDGEWKWNKVNGVNWMCDANGNVRNSSEDNHPVLYVSWNDAKEFCEWVSRKTGKNFRLPTEAEWEYAARGGVKSKGYKYAGSGNIDEVAWYGNSGSNSNANGMTHPVKGKNANELGLYDMSGNAWEWCSDWYGSYSSSPQTNPKGPDSGSDRVCRGGGWSSNAGVCRSSNRSNGTPGVRNSHLGLRLALLP